MITQSALTIEHAAQELELFIKSDWQDIQGVTSLILIATGGTLNYDFSLAGQMAETPLLQRTHHLKSVLTALQRPLSRCRVISLPQGKHDLQEHSFHRYIRQLIYIPLLTCSDTEFYLEDQRIALDRTLPYVLTGQKAHSIINPYATPCIYLQVETLAIAPGHNAAFLEEHHFEVLTPEQLQLLINCITTELANSTLVTEKKAFLQEQLCKFVANWHTIYKRFGTNWAGELHYQTLLQDFADQLIGKQVYLTPNAQHAAAVIGSMLQAFNHPKAKRHFSRYFFANHHPLPCQDRCPRFERPIFIVSAPRAGSTLLFEMLKQFPAIWSIDEESHELIEDIDSLHPASQAFSSNRLTELHASAVVVEELKRRFVRQLRNREGQDYLKGIDSVAQKSIRFLEKTPKNALRIPFLKAAFPDALFVYLSRDPKENISSLLEGWRSLRFIAYRNLPNWPHRYWSFILPADWRTLHDASLAAIAFQQWKYCTETIEADLKNIPMTDWYHVSYGDLINSPGPTLMGIANFTGLNQDANTQIALTQNLPISRLTLSPPASSKWRKYALEINEVLSN